MQVKKVSSFINSLHFPIDSATVHPMKSLMISGQTDSTVSSFHRRKVYKGKQVNQTNGQR